MKLIGNLNVNNKVSVGTYDAGESTLLVYGGAHFGKGARKSKQDDVLSFNAADGAWNTYFELVQDSWSGSHGLLFNAVKEPGSFEGNLELSGHTTYPFSHNPTSNQAHAGLLAFYGNGGGRYVFNISNQKDGFVEGDDIDWDRVFLLWKDPNDREKNYAQLNGQIKIVDGTQGNNKVLTSDADGLATWEDIPDNSYTLSYNSKTTEISLLDSEGRVVSTITHRDLDFQQLTWNGSTYDLTISNGNTVNLSELVGGMVADTNTYVSSGQLNGTNLDLLLSDGSSVSSIDLSDLLDDTNLWSPKPSGNNIYRSIGNVGIGTSTPSNKLHVEGSAKITSNIFLDGTIHFPYVDNTQPAASDLTETTTLHTALFMDMDGDNSYLEYGHVDNTMTYTQFRIVDNNTGDRFRIYVDDYHGQSSDRIPLEVRGDRVLLSQDGGNVGIGTDNPKTNLHIQAPEGEDAILRIETDLNNTGGETDTPKIEFVQDGGNIESAIGHDLITSGSLDPNSLQIANSVVQGGGIAFATDNNNSGYANADVRMFISSDGDVGIGTSTPDSKLHVDGQVKIVDGSEGVEKVLTSDASGLASWEDLSTLLQNVDLGEDKYLVSGGLLDGTPNGRCNTKILKLIMSDASEIDIDVSQLIRDNYVSNLLFDDATNILTLVHSTPDGCGEAPQQTIDLSSLAGGGADTYLASASLAGNILQLGLNTGTDYNVDLSSLAGGGNSSDADWKISGNDMYSEPTGNVGIGKDTPQSKLHVKDNNAILTLETIANAGGNFIDYTDSAGTKAKVGFISDKTEDFYIWNTESNGAINLINSPGTMALSAQNGQVGIGGIGPLGTHSLSVEGTTHLKETNRNDVLTMTSNDSIFSFGGVSGVGNKTNNVILQHRPQSGGANSSSSWQTRAANTTEKPEGEIAIELTTYFTNNGENIDYNAVAMNSGINKVNILGATNRDNTAILSLQSDSKITFQSHSISWPSDSRETMTIDIANDKVGINQSSPDVDLHINGQIKIVDGTQSQGKVLTSNADGLASWQTPAGGTSFPVGSIIQFAGDTAPAGWLMCDGSVYDSNTYSTLYSVIGVTYGFGDVDGGFPGDDSDNFTASFMVPNLNGRVPVGRNNNDSDFNSLGETGGKKEETLAASQIPHKSHTHTINEAGSGHYHPIGWVHDGSDAQSGNKSEQRAQNVLNGHSVKHVNVFQDYVITGNHGFTGSGEYPNGRQSDANHSKAPIRYDTTQGEHSHSMSTGSASNNSNGGPHNNLQPYIVLNYIIYAGV